MRCKGTKLTPAFKALAHCLTPFNSSPDYPHKTTFYQKSHKICTFSYKHLAV